MPDDPKKSQIVIEYHEFDLEKVMDYFIKDFNGKIEDAKWYLDPVKQKVIFRLMIEHPKKEAGKQ